MNNLYKVEFIKGENVCRFDGELSTEEWWKNKCGIIGEVEIEENYILKDDNLYIKDKSNVYSILEAIGKYYAPEKEYDRIANKGYGETQAWTRKSILGEKGAFVITNPDWLKDVKIKSHSQFKKDYPKFNEKEYQKLQQSLDKFYEKVTSPLP